MATVRSDIEAQTTEIATQASTTRDLLSNSMVSGSDTVISVVLAILEAITNGNTANTALSTAIAGLRADLANYNTNRTTEAAALLTATTDGLALIDSTLQLINTDTGNILSYLQTNVGPPLPLIYNQLLAIGRNQLALACLCTDGAPALPPPLDLNTPADLAEHCRRVQYFIDKLTDGVCAVTGAIADGLSITSDIAAAFFGAGVIPGIALASLPTALITGAIVVLGQMASAQILETCTFLQTHSEGLINALYNADSAASAQQSWYAYVDANTNAVTELDLRLILKAGAWAGGMNAIYDQSLEWDTSPYSATNCGDFTGCLSIVSTLVTNTGAVNSTYNAAIINWPALETPGSLNTTGGTVNQSPMAWRYGDITGWTYKVLAGTPSIVYRPDPPETGTGFTVLALNTDGLEHTFPLNTGTFIIYQDTTASEAFTVEICPNEGQ